MLVVLSKSTPENDPDGCYTFFNVRICRIFYRREENTHQRRGESHEIFHWCVLLSLPVCVSEIRSSKMKWKYSSKHHAYVWVYCMYKTIHTNNNKLLKPSWSAPVWRDHSCQIVFTDQSLTAGATCVFTGSRNFTLHWFPLSVDFYHNITQYQFHFI